MSLIEKWEGRIRLPEIKLDQQRVARNLVTQLAFGKTIVEGKIFESEYPGHDMILTNLSAPYNKILIRRKGENKLSQSLFLCISPKEEYDVATINISNKWIWEYVDIITRSAKTDPSEIVLDWKGKFDFTQADTETTHGLRPPQLGALHAISAHFSVGSNFEPATIVLPTGTGKTETMLASLIFNRIEKLLVLVPSNALRQQIFDKFCTLGILPLIGVTPADISRPRVAKIDVGLRTTEEAIAILTSANVIIATPDILKASDEESVNALCEGCTDLFIDEAHHSPASTWDFIRNLFISKKVTQFTATPFRNDNKHIGGKIIFNYKLGAAQDDGYFKPIRLKTIQEWGIDETKNRAIAVEALAILKNDLEQGFDHILMARVDKISKVEGLLSIYRGLAPEFAPVFAYSTQTKRDNEIAIQAVFSRSSRIIICVDMLGEGFDLPNLKVVAIHDGHKSLAVTLQFIGRFTRTASNVSDAAAVINLADPQTEKNLRRLYSDGANWDKLIRRLSEERIGREKNLQDIIESLKETGNLGDQISLWNLHPSFTAQIYRTTCDEWLPEKYEEVLSRGIEHWNAVSETKKLLVVLGLEEVPVKWGSNENLVDISYGLLIAYWNQEQGALFIYSNDYDGFRVEKLALEITDQTAILVNGPSIFNILNNVELPLAKNLGTSRSGMISFTSYFGPNVTEGLASIDRRESKLNNIACVGYENGDRVLWGGSERKGKIWSMKSGSIAEWVDWCDNTWAKVSDETLENPNIIRDFLTPIKLEQPYPGVAIGIQWGEHIQTRQSDTTFVYFGENEVQLYLVDINVTIDETNDAITIVISSELYQSVYSFKIDSTLEFGYHYQLISGSEVFFKLGRTKAKKTLTEYVISDPFIIYYNDGKYSYNNYYIPVDINEGEFTKESIESIDWSGIPLNAESMDKSMNQQTIQYRTFEEIQNSYDFIFNDDGTGEAADLVCLKDIDESTIELCLYHCKNAKDAKLSTEIENFYTVCGQAQKSIRVKHAGIPNLAKDLRRREALWARTSHTRILKGSLMNLAYFEEKSRKSNIKFGVVLVQPGLNKNEATPGILKLLATTELYLKKTTNASFRVICSAV